MKLSQQNKLVMFSFEFIGIMKVLLQQSKQTFL